MYRKAATFLSVIICFVFFAAAAWGAEPEQFDLFVGGRDGYHTYRIPAMVVSAKGTVLAFCEARKNSPADYGDIDLVVKRSLDGGKTWGPMQMIWDVGEKTVGNPAPVEGEAARDVSGEGGVAGLQGTGPRALGDSSGGLHTT